MALNLRGKIEIINESYKIGDIVKVQILLIHPMENGIMEDKATGNIKPANYISSIKVTYNNDIVANFNIGPSTSQNPRFIFPVKITGKGQLKAIMQDVNGNIAEKVTEVN
jgi:sulfur-oxidizing protein SoxZ